MGTNSHVRFNRAEKWGFDVSSKNDFLLVNSAPISNTKTEWEKQSSVLLYVLLMKDGR